MSLSEHLEAHDVFSVEYTGDEPVIRFQNGDVFAVADVLKVDPEFLFEVPAT